MVFFFGLWLGRLTAQLRLFLEPTSSILHLPPVWCPVWERLTAAAEEIAASHSLVRSGATPSAWVPPQRTRTMWGSDVVVGVTRNPRIPNSWPSGQWSLRRHF